MTETAQERITLTKSVGRGGSTGDGWKSRRKVADLGFCVAQPETLLWISRRTINFRGQTISWSVSATELILLKLRTAAESLKVYPKGRKTWDVLTHVSPESIFVSVQGNLACIFQLHIYCCYTADLFGYVVLMLLLLVATAFFPAKQKTDVSKAKERIWSVGHVHDT